MHKNKNARQTSSLPFEDDCCHCSRYKANNPLTQLMLGRSVVASLLGSAVMNLTVRPHFVHTLVHTIQIAFKVRSINQKLFEFINS